MAEGRGGVVFLSWDWRGGRGQPVFKGRFVCVCVLKELSTVR